MTFRRSPVPGDNAIRPCCTSPAVANRVHSPVHDDHGPISSIYDFLTFGVASYGGSTPATNAPLFRTGWFVESLATQTLVVFVIRTAGNPFKSRPSGRLPDRVGGRRRGRRSAAVHASRPCSALPHYPCRCWPRSRCWALDVPVPGWQAVKTWFYRRHAFALNGWHHACTYYPGSCAARQQSEGKNHMA